MLVLIASWFKTIGPKGLCQGWVKTGISQDKTIQDRDKILKLKTRQTQDRHIAVKTIQDFQVIENLNSRQVKNFHFSKFARQDRSRQDSCQEKFKNSWLFGLFLADFGYECWSFCSKLLIYDQFMHLTLSKTDISTYFNKLIISLMGQDKIY